jgi:hypothetical protein
MMDFTTIPSLDAEVGDGPDDGVAAIGDEEAKDAMGDSANATSSLVERRLPHPKFEWGVGPAPGERGCFRPKKPGFFKRLFSKKVQAGVDGGCSASKDVVEGTKVAGGGTEKKKKEEEGASKLAVHTNIMGTIRGKGARHKESVGDVDVKDGTKMVDTVKG